MVWGVIGFGVSAGKVKQCRYIAQVVNTVLLSFLRQEGDVFFQRNNTRPRTAAVTQRALRGAQLLPWSAISPDLSPIEHERDMLKLELTLLPEPTTTIAEFR